MTSPNEAWIGSASRQAALPAPLRDLHRAVLRRFLDSGTVSALNWLRQAARELGLGDSAVAELEAADLVHCDGGVVTVAYPFSGAPTRQQVELDGFPPVWAMCAIDALGIPVMAGRDGRIAASDPRDGAAVVVSVQDGQWRWTPPRGPSGTRHQYRTVRRRRRWLRALRLVGGRCGPELPVVHVV